MLPPPVPSQETTIADRPSAVPGDVGGLTFEIQARRKEEQEWGVVAQLRHEDDAKAALWAIVFTGQYSAVTVRRAGSATLVAEWPAGLSTLH